MGPSQVISHAEMSMAKGCDHGCAVMTGDVQRAYAYAASNRQWFVRIRKEDRPAKHCHVLKVNACVCGTRDAAERWQEELGGHLQSIGFSQGCGQPAAFHSAKVGIFTVVRGNDYVSPKWTGGRIACETSCHGTYPVQTRQSRHVA